MLSICVVKPIANNRVEPAQRFFRCWKQQLAPAFAGIIAVNPALHLASRLQSIRKLQIYPVAGY